MFSKIFGNKGFLISSCLCKLWFHEL